MQVRASFFVQGTFTTNMADTKYDTDDASQKQFGSRACKFNCTEQSCILFRARKPDIISRNLY